MGPRSARGGLLAAATRLAAQSEEMGRTLVPERFRAPHILGLRAPDRDVSALVGDLASKGIYVAARGENIRIGAHIYNDDEDVARFTAALRRCLR